MSWLDDLPGVKTVVDGTGAVDVVLPARSRLRVVGPSSRLSDDPSGGQSVLTVGVPLIPTALKSAAYSAKPGELVLASLTTGSFAIALPSAAAPGEQVAAKVIGVSSSHTLSFTADDTIHGFSPAAPTLAARNATIVFLRGVSMWLCISYLAGSDS